MKLVDDSSIDARLFKKYPAKDNGFFFHETSGGYTAYTKKSFYAITFFNIVLALVLIFLSLPVFLIVGLIIVMKYGWPVFYKGSRLGLHKKIFFMYKFRTLPIGAQNDIGKSVLPSSHSMITPLAKFLRDTRLDELPQLFNILKGDMDFIGPRPVRPEIYDTQCADIRNYDKRFSVRPGLIGYSQLFTPHSTPKRIRSLIDNRSLKRKRKFSSDLAMIFFTIFIVIKEIIVKLTAFLVKTYHIRILKRYTEIRSMERIVLKSASAKIYLHQTDTAQKTGKTAKVIDINDNYLKICCMNKLEKNNYSIILEINKKMGRYFRKKNRHKIAVVHGELFRQKRLHGSHFEYEYVFKYKTDTPLNQFIIDSYFLDKSMA